MTSAKSGFGATLDWGGTTIAELTSISGPSESADTVDVTSHDSSNEFREFIVGLRDGGEISIEGNFYPGDTDGQKQLHTDMQAGSSNTFTLTAPDGTTNYSGTAICTGFEPSFPMDGAMTFSATLKISGKPTLATS